MWQRRASVEWLRCGARASARARGSIRTRPTLGSILIVAGAALLAGCGVAADGPIPSGGGSSLTAAAEAAQPRGHRIDASDVSGSIVLFTGSSPLEAKIMRDLIRGFEKQHPRIKVEFAAINRDYPTVVLTRFAGGAAPDVFVVDGKFFNDWSAKGLLLPLDGFLADQQIDMGRYQPRLLDAVKGPKGKTYAIPVNYSTISLFTNDAMLADAGITRPPTTWAELERDAKLLTTKGAANGGGASGDHVGLCLVPNWERMLLFALQQEGGLTNAAGTKMRVTSPQTRRAIDWVRHMLASGSAVSPELVGASWCGDAFGKRKVAMALEGAWMLPPMKSQYPDVQFSTHPLPMGTRRATLAYSGNMAISRTTSNPDASWLLLEYLASPSAQRRLADIGVGVPALSGVPYPEQLDSFAEGIDYATVWSLPAGFFNSVLITADNEMSAVLEGKQSVGGMLKEIDGIGSTMLEAAET